LEWWCEERATPVPSRKELWKILSALRSPSEKTAEETADRLRDVADNVDYSWGDSAAYGGTNCVSGARDKRS